MENNLILSFEKAFSMEILCKNAQMSCLVATAFIRLILALIPHNMSVLGRGGAGGHITQKIHFKKGHLFPIVLHPFKR